MRCKSSGFYLSTLAILGLAFGVLPGVFPRANVALADYTEECLHEGCNAEEVNELYASYKEECLHEGCNQEEVFELAGNAPGARQALLAEFRRRGFQVHPQDFGDPNCLGTETICTGVLFWCNDHCTFPDGTHTGWYLCGACFGFFW